MKEIEILYSLKEDIALSENKIQKFVFDSGEKFEYKGEKRVIDTYFKSKVFKDFDPRENNKLFSSLRVREVKGSYYVTHKRDNFDKDNTWIYSDELETGIENADVFKNLLKELHFEELIKIDNTKKIYESKNYELVLENVFGLGYFIEVEYKTNEEIKDKEVLGIKQEIRKLVEMLGIEVGEELNAGKPELMLRLR